MEYFLISRMLLHFRYIHASNMCSDSSMNSTARQPHHQMNAPVRDEILSEDDYLLMGEK